MNGNAPRGRKLILAVSANGSQQPPVQNLAMSVGFPAKAIGLMQDVEIVNLRVRDLPENPLGYDPVDAVLWLDGDPAELDAGGAHGLSALRDYVRFGGQLVITQSTGLVWQQTAGFADLMPVDVTGVAPKSNFEPLRFDGHRARHGRPTRPPTSPPPTRTPPRSGRGWCRRS